MIQSFNDSMAQFSLLKADRRSLNAFEVVLISFCSC